MDSTAAHPALAALLGAIGGGGLTAMLNVFLAHRRTATQQENDHDGVVIATLLARITSIEQREQQYMQREQECMQRTIEMSRQIGELQGIVGVSRGDVTRLSPTFSPHQ